MIQIDQSTRFKNMLIMTFFLVLLMGALYLLSYPDFFGLNLVPFSFFKNHDAKITEEQVLSIQESVFEEIAQPIYAFPKKLVVESIDLELSVVSIGVDEQGHLESPENWNEAGWYQKSAKPSEPGNLLINAHYDDISGRPVAFWKLKNVNVGDKVSVIDSYNRVYDYSVTRVFYVDINDPDRLSIVDAGQEDESLMTLVTCGGVWSPLDGTYSKRLVVSAELISY